MAKRQLTRNEKKDIERQVLAELERERARIKLEGRIWRFWKHWVAPLLLPGTLAGLLLFGVTCVHTSCWKPAQEKTERTQRIKSEILLRLRNSEALVNHSDGPIENLRDDVDKAVNGNAKTTAPEFKNQSMFILFWELKRITERTDFDSLIDRLEKFVDKEATKQDIRNTLDRIRHAVDSL